MIEGLRFVYTSAEVASALTAEALRVERLSGEDDARLRRSIQQALDAAHVAQSTADGRESLDHAEELTMELKVLQQRAADTTEAYRDAAAHIPPGETFALAAPLSAIIDSLLP